MGKTTCSAAVAVATAAGGMRTLHITSDLAPSLSDIYGINIGDTPTSVTENLDAMEISQERIAATWKEKFGPDFVHILSHILDMDGMEQNGRLDLLDYIGTAPALREETLLDLIVEMALQGRYGRIIWDTAPAGETLNLLYMPRLMRDHLRAGAKVYEAVDRLAGAVSGKRSLAGIMQEWVVRSEGIAAFLRERTLFFLVANPEALVVNQVQRLMATLRQIGFTVRGMIINRVAVADGSPFLERMEQGQKPYMDRLLALSEGLAVARVDLTLEEIRGVGPLGAIGRGLTRELGLAGR
ncbi:MAG: ArsA family ATPase [bacterium]|nr:MAG: ArsA family ATPase [bacterium]